MPKYCNETKVMLYRYYPQLAIVMCGVFASLFIEIEWLRIIMFMLALILLYKLSCIIKEIKSKDPCLELGIIFRKTYWGVVYYQPANKDELSKKLQGMYDELVNKKLNDGITISEAEEYISQCKEIHNFVEELEG